MGSTIIGSRGISIDCENANDRENVTYTLTACPNDPPHDPGTYVIGGM